MFSRSLRHHLLATLIIVFCLHYCPAFDFFVNATSITNYYNRSQTIRQLSTFTWQVDGYPSDQYSPITGHINSLNRFSIVSRSRFRTLKGQPYSLRFIACLLSDDCPVKASGDLRLNAQLPNAVDIRLNDPWMVEYQCRQLRWWWYCTDKRTGITVVRIVHSLDMKKFSYIPLRTEVNWLGDRFHFDLFTVAYIYCCV
jgi:hypothetical protein